MKNKIRICLIVLVVACIALGGLYYNQNKDRIRYKKLQEQVAKIYTTSYQKKVQKTLDAKKQKKNYTEDHMLIEMNPFGTNTLSAYVYFKTEDAVSVTYTISAKSTSDFTQTAYQSKTYQKEHEFQLIGLVPDKENTITFTLTREDGSKIKKSKKITVGSLMGDEKAKLKTLDKTNADQLSDGLYVILGNDSDSQDFMYYYDNDGNIRGEIPIIDYRSHRLLFHNGYMYYSADESMMVRMNRLGMIDKIYDLGQYELHHDYVFKEDDTMLILATDTEKDDIVEDEVISLNVDTGKVSKVVDMKDLLPEYYRGKKRNSSKELDWIHLNTIQYVAKDDSIIVSSRETSTIIDIENVSSSPSIKYMIGNSDYWKDSAYSSLLYSQLGEFSNTGGQHAVTYEKDSSLADGQYYLYMFNNNFGISVSNPSYDWSSISGIQTSMSSLGNSYFYQYLVDENAKTYTLVKKFAVPFSSYVSSVQKKDGNVIVDSGFQGIIGEYDGDGNLLAQFKMDLNKYFIYRVFKYDFKGFYFL